MIYNILAVGDVVGACGVKHLSRCLRSLKKQEHPFHGRQRRKRRDGRLTPNDADDIFAAGADVITLGNHTFGKMQIRGYLDDCPYPAPREPRQPRAGTRLCGSTTAARRASR